MAEYEVEEREVILGNVGFGKFAMSKWRDLPENYLEYLVSDECLTNDENKAKARKELRNRLIQPGQMKLKFEKAGPDIGDGDNMP